MSFIKLGLIALVCLAITSLEASPVNVQTCPLGILHSQNCLFSKDERLQELFCDDQSTSVCQCPDGFRCSEIDSSNQCMFICAEKDLDDDNKDDEIDFSEQMIRGIE